MILILMGVAGAGKTTIGKLLARKLGWQFLEGDDFHPTENREKMRQRIPLTDEDRRPWLFALKEQFQKEKNAIVACSALKKSYRQILAAPGVRASSVQFVYLQADFPLLQQRLRNRKEHFFPSKLLPSQLQVLEEPENTLTIDARLAPDEICQIIYQALNLSKALKNVPEHL